MSQVILSMDCTFPPSFRLELDVRSGYNQAPKVQTSTSSMYFVEN